MNTRIAPSPTGMFHLGTARTAYFNWLLARSTGGRFVLRIDDTDTQRNSDAAYDTIMDALDWLGLDHDEMWKQSKRLDVYDGVAQLLIDNGLAKRSDNSKLVLLEVPDYCIPTDWTDTIAGKIKVTDVDRRIIANTIIVKSDGMPTYNFCSIVDDIDMGIDRVVRGTDHINNTPKQLAIANCIRACRAMTHVVPMFTHIGLIHKDGKKMSKRDGAASLLSYRDDGYSRDAVLNFMLKLGWAGRAANFDSTYPLISKDDAIRLFTDAGQMRSQSANFDQAKLDWYDRKWKNRKEG